MRTRFSELNGDQPSIPLQLHLLRKFFDPEIDAAAAVGSVPALTSAMLMLGRCGFCACWRGWQRTANPAVRSTRSWSVTSSRCFWPATPPASSPGLSGMRMTVAQPPPMARSDPAVIPVFQALLSRQVRHCNALCCR